jgi:DNA-binding transcriptional LysR family regulator
MVDDVKDSRWKEFEELGEDQVRIRLAQHIWAEGTERLARQWLDRREASLAREATREANDLARRANDTANEANVIARNNNMIAGFALVAAGIAIAISILGLFLKRG